jgi:hypothetical protein
VKTHKNCPEKTFWAKNVIEINATPTSPHPGTVCIVLVFIGE